MNAHVHVPYKGTGVKLHENNILRFLSILPPRIYIFGFLVVLPKSHFLVSLAAEKKFKTKKRYMRWYKI